MTQLFILRIVTTKYVERLNNDKEQQLQQAALVCPVLQGRLHLVCLQLEA